ncbi:MAG: hypothetical protein Tsb0016_01080 [Sphingomonadales bacterium]
MLEQLSHGPFIWASYGIAGLLLASLGLWSWRRAKALEQAATLAQAQGGRRRRRDAGADGEARS